jgi:hypothetical protein
VVLLPARNPDEQAILQTERLKLPICNTAPRLRFIPTSHDVAATGCLTPAPALPEWANTHKATCPAAPYANLAAGLFFNGAK